MKDKIHEYYQQKVKEALEKQQSNVQPSYKERYEKIRNSDFFNKIYKNASIGENIPIDYGKEDSEGNTE